MIRVLVRVLAIAIALASLIDPGILIAGASRARLAIVQLDSRSDASRRVRDRLVHNLGSSFEIVSQLTSDAAAAIVIGDRYPAESVPDALRVATVTIAQEVPGVRVVRIDAPREVPAGTAIHVEVEAEGVGVSGQTAELRARIEGLEMGRTTHAWTSGRERWHAAFDVVPVGTPPYVVRVEATQAFRPAVVADVVVDARRRPLRVEFFDPRPSWASTFVRRALEADARFETASLSTTSRGIASRTGEPVALTDARIDAFDVVVVGGLDRLSAADARALDRFTRERGGAVVLLPDARLGAGPARDLLPIELRERLLERATTLSTEGPLPGLDASELLVAADRRGLGGSGSDPADQAGPTGPALQIIARMTGADAAPVVASVPRGEGRLLWSGAMDAWRFRAGREGAFDRFWQSTIAGLALAVPPLLDVHVEPALLARGESADVIVRERTKESAPVSARVDGVPIRLHPDPEAGVFRGTFVARDTPGRSHVEARSAGSRPQSASATVIVDADPHRVQSQSPPTLSLLSASHRGIDVAPDHLDQVERFVSKTIVAQRETIVRYPMRSAWWVLPLSACLCGEWWVRRRRGER